MRKSKKILAVTLAAAMLWSVLPASQANAAVKHKGVVRQCTFLQRKH